MFIVLSKWPTKIIYGSKDKFLCFQKGFIVILLLKKTCERHCIKRFKGINKNWKIFLSSRSSKLNENSKWLPEKISFDFKCLYIPNEKNI